MKYKKSVSDFAAKLERIPKELRAMSGVPSEIRKPARQAPTANAPSQSAVVEAKLES